MRIPISFSVVGCFLCASAVLPALGQGIWTLQRPVPSDLPLFAIQAVDKDRIIACGDRGQIFRTEDGGASWKQAIGGTTLRLFGLAAGAGEPQVLFAVGDSGTILTSADGGVTWITRPSGTRTRLNAVSAVDAGTAFVGGADGTLLKTLDGGATWAALASGTRLTFRSLSAADAQVVYAVSTKDTLFKTSDGGATWKAHFIAPIRGMSTNGAGMYGVSALDRDTVFVSALDVVDPYPRRWVYRTTDGGSRWEPFDTTWGGISYAISAVSGRTAFVSGFAELHSTQDAGATWTTRRTPDVAPGYVQSNDAISAADSRTAFATGSFGMIMVTTDGGQTWSQKPERQPMITLHAIRAVNPTLAFASGADGTFLRTTDGGTWKALPLDTARPVEGFDTRDGALILAASGRGILRSPDGGETWSWSDISAVPSIVTLTTVAFGDARTVFAAGKNGTLLKSADAGATWNLQAGGTRWNVNALQSLSATHALAACDSGVFLKTVDGGATWDSLPTGTRKNLLALHFLDASFGYLAGNSGTLLRTEDGGATWNALPNPNSTNPIHAVRALDRNTAYFSGYRGRILKTTDGGATWTPEISYSPSTLRAISIVDGTTAYAAGEFGSIVKLSGGSAAIGGGKWRSAHPVLRLVGGSLHADLPVHGALSGRMVDLQGRRVSFLDFGWLQAGRHILPMARAHGGPYLLDLRFGKHRQPLLLPRR